MQHDFIHKTGVHGSFGDLFFAERGLNRNLITETQQATVAEEPFFKTIAMVDEQGACLLFELYLLMQSAFFGDALALDACTVTFVMSKSHPCAKADLIGDELIIQCSACQPLFEIVEEEIIPDIEVGE